jgi:small subunit ribosomal protein S20
MPNIKSAKKRVKVIATKTAHNKEIKSALKTSIKKAEAVSLAVKKIDQAAAKGIMHKNKASRSKANLAKRLNASA